MARTYRRCETCQGPIWDRSKTGLCRACKRAARALRAVCPRCRGPMDPYGNHQRCRACYEQEQPLGNPATQLRGFDAVRFRAIIEHAGWTIAALSLASGRPRSTIRDWLAGTIPQREEFAPVAAALALELCPGCHGVGYVDPTMNGVGRVLKRLTGRAS